MGSGSVVGAVGIATAGCGWGGGPTSTGSASTLIGASNDPRPAVRGVRLVDRQERKAHLQRHTDRQRSLLIGRATIDPDPTRGTNRLDLPLVVAIPKDRLDIAEAHLVKPDLALDAATDPDRP